MQVNNHDTRTPLSRDVAQALEGEEIVIARAGRPLVRLVPVAPEAEPRRGGFLRGAATAGADLKADFAAEIQAMFRGDSRRGEG
jgi:antitoxin (DNA-binding transcriptional repressor) of toxin-antitoxin stability system